jgi:glycosyltransferase involved in cell wall biosynthesis
MHILMLNPYHGGSHAAFVDGWRAHSRHMFDLLTLPAHDWKWRMRHAAITLAERVNAKAAAGESWDALWCTDMLNLAEFRGLCDRRAFRGPAVIYFHENQLTYPVRHPDERDLHFGFTNFASALAADAVWFNSEFHRQEFLDALRAGVKRMPDYQPVDQVDAIEARSAVMWPGVELERAVSRSRKRRDGEPLHLIWAARWEHDKNPGMFFAALDELVRRDIDFYVSVIGESFREVPEVFDRAKQQFADRIVRWGYQPSRAGYEAALVEADVFVSTADHEFFGLAAVEAAMAGCVCVLPRKLAYPEVFRDDGAEWYDGTVEGLVEAIEEVPQGGASLCLGLERYAWPARAAAMDDALDALRGG